MEIEATVCPGRGNVRVTGIVEEEEIGGNGHTMRRKSTAFSSAQNVTTVLREMGYMPRDRDVHINFPGGMPVDGPSAGVAMAVVAVSALTGRPVDAGSAITGEISVQGYVKPVGGVPEKIEAARRAGLARVLVPRDNYLERFARAGIAVVPVDTVAQALDALLLPSDVREEKQTQGTLPAAPMAAVARSMERTGA